MKAEGSFNLWSEDGIRKEPDEHGSDLGSQVTLSPRPLRECVAREIMSKPAIACTENAHFEEVAALLADREISGVPVVDREDHVVGVISERDLAHALGGPLIRLAIRKPVHSGPFLRTPHGVTDGVRLAKDIMTTPPVVVHPETPLRTLAEIMVKDQVNRIPVVRDGRLLGVVTRGDVLGAVAGLVQTRVNDLEQAPIIVGEGT